MADKGSPGTISMSAVTLTPGCSAGIYVDSVRAMAESIGAPNLHEEAAKELAEDVTYRLRHILQDAVKFMEKGKRVKLSTDDFTKALTIRNTEPIYSTPEELTPYRFVSGGGRELHFIDEKELDLQDMVNTNLPKVPLDLSIRTHWLVIEGIQPSIPENPPLLSRDQQRLDSVDPAGKHKGGTRNARTGPFTPPVGKPIKFKTSEQVFIKQLATHELSVEQQLYYKEITEACVGSDEARRSEALMSLTNDPGLFELLPRLCTFIAEGVRINVVQYMLALLIYLMRMVKALLDNPTLYLEKYLHELIPSVTTCVVSKQLCIRPEADNHWALRDFAAKLLAIICKNYTTTTNNIQTRITQVFSSAITNEKTPLASVYGAISGFGELGPKPLKVFVIPRIKEIGTRLEFSLEGVGHTQADKIAAMKIKQLIGKILSPVLKNLTPESLDDYKTEHGIYMGPFLHNLVLQQKAADLKQAQQQTSSTPAKSSPSSATAHKSQTPRASIGS